MDNKHRTLADATSSALCMSQPSYEDYLSCLRDWERCFPGRMRVTECGRSSGGRPLVWGRITDQSVNDDEKQMVLLTCTHGEAEISGVCGILHFMKWLLYSEEAASLRAGVCVAAMPIIHADTYELNQQDGGSRYGSLDGCELYGEGQKSLTWSGVRPGISHPEAEALLAVMDEVQPDAHLDIHGTQSGEFGMRENVAVSRPRLDRCYDPSVPEALARAIDASGGCAIREELQGGHLDTAAPEEDIREVSHLYNHMPTEMHAARLMVTPVMLSYVRYHAVSMVAELGWMRSVVAACRRLVELGLEVQPEELFPGYRNHLLMPAFNLLACAWGETPGQRRRSRVELWQRHGLAMQADTRVPPSRVAYGSCATTSEGLRLLGVDPKTGRGEGVGRFLAMIERDERFNADALRTFFRDYPSDDFARLLLYNAPRIGSEDESPIRNGLALRLHLQHAEAKIEEVRLNGHLLGESATDGYLVKRCQGTAVHVSIPPGKVHDLHVVTIRYSAPERPVQGFSPEDRQSDTLRVT